MKTGVRNIRDSGYPLQEHPPSLSSTRRSRSPIPRRLVICASAQRLFNVIVTNKQRT
ncbi:hypothetical protein Droror1_Dr00017409 [Drosera rotundifolia]